jgi:hypothetical protein
MTHHPQDPQSKSIGKSGGHQLLSKNLIVYVAKKAILVVLIRKFVDFLDHVLSNLNQKVRSPKVGNLKLPVKEEESN